MPQLPQYSAPIREIQIDGGRRAQASDFSPDYVGAAKGLSNAVTIYKERAEAAETREAMIAGSEIRAKYAKELDDATLSGAPLEPIRQRMQEEMDKVGEKFVTGRGLDAIRQYRASNDLAFQNESNRIEVARAGAAARVEGSRFLKAAGDRIELNPLELNTLLKEANDFVKTLPGLTPEKRAEIYESLSGELNEAAVRSAIRKAPADALGLLKDGKWELTTDQREQLIHRANGELSLKRSLEENERNRLRREKAELDEQARLKYDRMLIGNEKISATQFRLMITQDKDLSSRSLEHFDQVLRMRNKESRAVGSGGGTTRTNPAVFNRLRAAIDLPPGSPGRLSDPLSVWDHYGNGLSIADATRLEKRILDNRNEKGQKFSSAMDSFIRTVAKPQLDKSTMVSIDKSGGERVQSFTIHVQEQAANMEKKGEDPFTMFDPRSPSYIGRDIPMFQSGAQRRQTDVANKLNKAFEKGAPPAKRRPMDEMYQEMFRRGK